MQYRKKTVESCMPCAAYQEKNIRLCRFCRRKEFMPSLKVEDYADTMIKRGIGLLHHLES